MAYVTREGPLNATGDIWATLSTLGSDSSPGPCKVPSGKTKLKQIIFSYGDNTPTGTEGGQVTLLKLDGSGMKGQKVLPLVARSMLFDTAGEAGESKGHQLIETDMDVEAGGAFTMQGCPCLGVDWGSPELGVTLGFE